MGQCIGRFLFLLLLVGGVAACATTPPADLQGREIVIGTPLGTDFTGYIAGPEAADKAVLLVHEYWGFNQQLKREADRLAEQGYRVLAVDLFDGRSSNDPAVADLIVSQVDPVTVDVDLKAAVRYLHHPGRKVITMGWGYGGAPALRAAQLVPRAVAATVMYYGLPVTQERTAGSRQPVDKSVLQPEPAFATDVQALEAMQGPVLAVFARHDPWITEQEVAGFVDAMRKARQPLRLVRLEAERGFYDPLSPGYNPRAVEATRRYTRQFLAAELGGE